MDVLFLIAAVFATIVSGISWARAVVKAGVEGPEPNNKGAIPSAVWCALFMILGFLTLQLFARDFAVWAGYARKPF